MKTSRTKIFTEEKYKVWRHLWEAFSIGLLNLNSFLLLYYRHGNHYGIKYVICAAASAYTLMLLIHFFLYRHDPSRHAAALKIRNTFRVIYVLIYLTVIMLDVLALMRVEHTGTEIAVYGWLFLWVIVWGSKRLWFKRLWSHIRNIITIIQDKNSGESF